MILYIILIFSLFVNLLLIKCIKINQKKFLTEPDGPKGKDKILNVPNNFLEYGSIQKAILHHNYIFINFNNSDKKKKIILFAAQDCCSDSWFELLNETLDSIIGKEIKNIESKEFIDLPDSGIQECDQNQLISIEFIDNSKFDFVLRNSSNGYYSGWLEIRYE